MNDELGAAEVVDQLLRDCRELGLVAQELVADAMHLERVFVAVALGVEIEMAVVAGELASHELDAADFDDTVARFCRKAGGFGVQYDLAHRAIIATAVLAWSACPSLQWFSLAWLIEYLGISTVRSCCATMA